jgi:nicotinamidase-related amidase
VRQKRLAILLIDMQELFVRRLRKGEEQRIAYHQREVLSWCAHADIPVVVIRYAGAARVIAPLQKSLKGIKRTIPLTKWHDDAFYRTPLARMLKSRGITDVFLMGINAAYCVRATAQGALCEGFSICTSNAVISDRQLKNNMIPWYKKNGIVFPTNGLIKKLSVFVEQGA